MLHDLTQIALERALAGSSMRHSALAANVANANTPGYQRKDVSFHDTLARAVEAGDPASLRGTTFAATTDPAAVTRADGSSIDIDVEAAALSANALEHQALSQAAGVRYQILEIAMGVR